MINLILFLKIELPCSLEKYSQLSGRLIIQTTQECYLKVSIPTKIRLMIIEHRIKLNVLIELMFPWKQKTRKMPKRGGIKLNKERSPEIAIKRSSRLAEIKVYIFPSNIRNKKLKRLINDSAPCRWRIPLLKEHPQNMWTRSK